jgi:Asp-tRNA(Asn)/Glu-tRNA(Gln) amidotransferase A subunit family amidase
MIDAVGMAELVHRGDATPPELVTDAIARIERINPLLNAVARPPPFFSTRYQRFTPLFVFPIHT